MKAPSTQFKSEDEDTRRLLAALYVPKLGRSEIREIEDAAGGKERLLRCLRQMISRGAKYAPDSLALLRSAIMNESRKL